MEQGASRRCEKCGLALALAVSAAVHLSLIFGIAARSPAGPPGSSSILARVEPVEAGRPAAPGQAAALSAEPIVRRGDALAPAGARVSPRPTASTTAARPVALAPAESLLPTAELLVPADAAWYEVKDLDVLPRALTPLRPTYPSMDGKAQSGGTVILLVLIDETGQVREVSAVKADPEADLGPAAIATFADARFSPGQRDGRAVRSRMLVRVTFEPAAAQGDDASNRQ